MERKQIIYALVLIHCGLCLCLLTLSCIEHNSGRVTQKEVVHPDYQQRVERVLTYLGRSMERQRCLSAVIKSASDTKLCFDCHDKITPEYYRKWSDYDKRKDY